MMRIFFYRINNEEKIHSNFKNVIGCQKYKIRYEKHTSTYMMQNISFFLVF